MNIDTTMPDIISNQLAVVIARRGARLFAPNLDVLTILMDLAVCHNHNYELDLVAFASGRDTDLVHDIAGINAHLNRTTGKLEDYFVPRFAKN